MTESPPNVPQLWHFTYPLAYLLVDGKQVVNNDIDLVLRREAVIAAHPAYRHRHTLRIYTNGINPKVGASLPLLPAPSDGYLTLSVGRAVVGSIHTITGGTCRPGIDTILSPATPSNYQGPV